MTSVLPRYVGTYILYVLREQDKDNPVQLQSLILLGCSANKHKFASDKTNLETIHRRSDFAFKEPEIKKLSSSSLTKKGVVFKILGGNERSVFHLHNNIIV